MTTYTGTLSIASPRSTDLALADDVPVVTGTAVNANFFNYVCINDNSSFVFGSCTITSFGTKWIQTIPFTYTLSGTSGNDGLKLRLPIDSKTGLISSSWEISDLQTIPLSRSGSQFLNYPNTDIGGTDPTILPNTSFANIFENAAKNDADINDWNIANVTDMTSAFEGNTAFNQDLSSWDVGNVVNMTSMFEGATAFNQNINNWNVGSVTSMDSMFSGDLAFNQPLNNWNVSSVKSMNQMFYLNEVFNQPINDWNVGSVTDMSGMFQDTDVFNQPLTDWNVGSVTNMSSMFQNAIAFNKSILLWNVGNVTNMSSMFQGATSFNQNCHWWDTSSVNNMSSMFQGATAFNGANVYWDTAAVQDFSNMFNGATVFDQPIELWTVTDSFPGPGPSPSPLPVVLTTMFSNATAMKNNTRYDDLPAGVDGPDEDTPNVAFFNQTTRWCLVAGTMITTDQGEIKIEELTKTNTINGLKVLGLSKNHVNSGEEMVLIEKDAFDENVPVKDVCMSNGHRVQYKGQLVKCTDLIGENEKIKMTKLEENQIIYNVLLEKYTTMKANNMDVETLEMHLKYQPGLVKLF